jgi:hypothetical protein
MNWAKGWPVEAGSLLLVTKVIVECFLPHTSRGKTLSDGIGQFKKHTLSPYFPETHPATQCVSGIFYHN